MKFEGDAAKRRVMGAVVATSEWFLEGEGSVFFIEDVWVEVYEGWFFEKDVAGGVFAGFIVLDVGIETR